MTLKRSFALDRVRTDGWFERLGESIGSFQTLCDVIGQRFFAFSLIVQARISSLMIDRQNPDHSVVEFCFSGSGDPDDEEPERVSVIDFRRRVVERVLRDEDISPLGASETSGDAEALQRHLGPRLLLLAPLFGFELQHLVVEGEASTLRVTFEGDEAEIGLEEFRRLVHEHVREELERAAQRASGTAIDLNHVLDAEKAAEEGRWDKVAQMLGGWPMPLAVYWRTPEGQMLPDTARQRIAEGLGLLGTACGKLGDPSQGEEVLRLAVQYAQEGSAASGIFARFGRVLMEANRPGEAIGPLRRAAMLATEDQVARGAIHVDLARCYRARGARVAALASVVAARQAGAASNSLEELDGWLTAEMGEPLVRWRALTGGK